MENSKLLDLLRVLQPKEIARLSDFIRSPFFNKQEVLVNLFDEIIRFAPNYQSPMLSKEAVFTRIFGENVPYNDTKTRLLMSDAVKLIEKFIAIDITENSEITQGINLLDFYITRQPKYFDPILKLARQVNEKHRKTSEMAYFHHNYLIELSIARFQSISNPSVQNNNIWEAARALDIYFLACKLRHYCNIYSLKQSIAVNEQLQMEETILRYMEVHNYCDIPILKIWYSAYLVITKSDEHHFELLCRYLQEYAGILSEWDLRNLYIYANNYCNRQFNKGNSRFYPIAFELFKRQIESKIIHDKGVFPQGVFKNMVTIAIRANETDWAYSFINNYYAMLPPPTQLITRHYSLAQVYLAKQDYEQTQKHIWEAQQQQNKDIYHKTAIYRLCIKLYYLTNEDELLENTLNTFRVFIHREKTVTETSRQSNRNFINTVFKLLELPFLPAEKTALYEQQLMAYEYVAERDWLLERIREIKSKSRL
ncbi:hypothetical protein C7N43_31615 [Sphingobacteriales bacterium UPWRP_1]|nr:hypothetical protein BVG80_01600 [Sphingobacteriales bacterium TSM_CSM]PSJ72942.1 hypothetical protein C7N43_31615 [Sphingobacteriales bacterium UPWRP_1]